MKWQKLLSASIAAIASINMSAQIAVEVSEPVELMSILARTAGFREYCMDMGGKYTEDTEAWFSPYENHAAVDYFQSLRNKYQIGYDAVMSMAINISTDGNHVELLSGKDALDSRWQNVDIDTFLVKLNSFYTETRLHEFYTKHSEFYAEVLRTYANNVMQHFRQDWYAKFYGTEPTERFRIVIGFTNGGGSYGPSRQLTGQPKEVFAICGYYVDSETGKSFENGLDYALTLIHEFNHSFVNPLLDNEANANLLTPIGQQLLKHSYYALRAQAYKNAQTVINESIVRAATIIYMQENGFSDEQIHEEMQQQIARDFAWMPELVAALHNYVANRDKYLTLNDFYPGIANCLSEYLKRENERIEKPLKRATL